MRLQKRKGNTDEEKRRAKRKGNEDFNYETRDERNKIT